MLKPLAAALLVLLQTSCASAQAEQKPEEPVGEVQRRHIEQLVQQITQRRADTQFCLGYDAMLAGQWERAARHLRATKGLAPDSIRTRCRLLKCLYELDQREAFEREAAALENMEPRCAPPKLYRAEFYVREGKHEEALAQYVALLEIEDPVCTEGLTESLQEAVKICIKRNDILKAMQFSQWIVEQDPSDETLIDRLRLARLQQITGRFESAYAHYITLAGMQRVRGVPVLRADVLWSLVAIGRRLKKVNKANGFLVQMLDIDGAERHQHFAAAVDLALQAGKECHERGEYGMAYELLRRAARFKAAARVYLAKAALETGHVNEAAELVDTLVTQQPDTIEVLLLAMRVNFVKRDTEAVEHYRERAIKALETSLKQQADPLHYYFLGTLQLQVRQLEKAEAALAKAVSMHPPDKLKWRCLLAIAKVDEAKGRNQSAEQHLQQIVQQERFPPAHYELARLLLNRKALQEADTHARQAIRADPSNAQYVQIYLDIWRSRLEEAGDRTQFRQALDWLAKQLGRQTSWEIYARVGDGYALGGATDRANAFWRKAIGLVSEEPEPDQKLLNRLRKKIESSHADGTQKQ